MLIKIAHCYCIVMFSFNDNRPGIMHIVQQVYMACAKKLFTIKISNILTGLTDVFFMTLSSNNRNVLCIAKSKLIYSWSYLRMYMLMTQFTLVRFDLDRHVKQYFSFVCYLGMHASGKCLLSWRLNNCRFCLVTTIFRDSKKCSKPFLF